MFAGISTWTAMPRGAPGISRTSAASPNAEVSGKGVGVTSPLANFSGHFFLIWTLIAIGVTALLRHLGAGLWDLRGVQSPSPNAPLKS